MKDIHKRKLVVKLSWFAELFQQPLHLVQKILHLQWWGVTGLSGHLKTVRSGCLFNYCGI
jgi:hypothetical protein